MKDFDTFSKIAYKCGWFEQNNCCHRLCKVAQSSINCPIWSHCLWPFSDVLHDPFGFSPDSGSSAGTTPPSTESWLSSRPRSAEKSEKRGLNSSPEGGKFIRPEYYNRLLNRVDKLLKVANDKIGKKNFEEKSFWGDCDEQAMAIKHLKCQVGNCPFSIGPMVRMHSLALL